MKGKKMNCELSCDFVILSWRMLGATQVIRVQVQWTNLNQVEHRSSWGDVLIFSFGFPFAWIGELGFLRRGGKQSCVISRRTIAQLCVQCPCQSCAQPGWLHMLAVMSLSSLRIIPGSWLHQFCFCQSGKRSIIKKGRT